MEKFQLWSSYPAYSSCHGSSLHPLIQLASLSTHWYNLLLSPSIDTTCFSLHPLIQLASLSIHWYNLLLSPFIDTFASLSTLLSWTLLFSSLLIGIPLIGSTEYHIIYQYCFNCNACGLKKNPVWPYIGSQIIKLTIVKSFKFCSIFFSKDIF